MEPRRFKVAYLIDCLSFGGAERQLSLIVRALQHEFTPVVISLSSDIHPFGEELRSEGIDVVAIERRGNVDLRRLWDAVRAIRSKKADLVHGFIDAANAYAFVSARALGKPVVLSLRNEVLRVSGAKAATLSWMLRRADRVLVNSLMGRDFLRNRVGVREDRIDYIPNWVDPKRAGLPVRIPPAGGAKTIGFVGRFARQKRVDLLVEAFRELTAHVPDARLVLMGEGNEREDVLRRIERHGLEGRVEVLGASPDVDATLARIDVFVLTSSFEGLPNAAIEALSTGMPVVSTRVGDMAELVVEGKTGAFFEDERPDSMARTLARVMNDRALIENAATAGPKLVEEKFSLRRAAERLADIYRTLASH